MSDKKVLINIGIVRISEYDNLNVMIERLEDVFNPIKKEATSKWRFKGYSDTILNALTFISNKELLIDKNAVIDLKSYLKQVEELNRKIKEGLKAVFEE